jgi:hypothetical protein
MIKTARPMRVRYLTVPGNILVMTDYTSANLAEQSALDGYQGRE